MWQTTVETGNRFTERVFRGGSVKDRCCVSVFASHSLGREGGLDGGGFVSLTLRNGQRELELLGLTHTKKKLCIFCVAWTRA